jgi:hypothetical protein
MSARRVLTKSCRSSNDGTNLNSNSLSFLSCGCCRFCLSMRFSKKPCARPRGSRSWGRPLLISLVQSLPAVSSISAWAGGYHLAGWDNPTAACGDPLAMLLPAAAMNVTRQFSTPPWRVGRRAQAHGFQARATRVLPPPPPARGTGRRPDHGEESSPHEGVARTQPWDRPVS